MGVCADQCMDSGHLADNSGGYLDRLPGSPADREHVGERGNIRGSQFPQWHTTAGKTEGGRDREMEGHLFFFFFLKTFFFKKVQFVFLSS